MPQTDDLDYSALATDAAAQQEQRLRASTTSALEFNPDEVAKQRRTASSLGVPVPVVQAAPLDSARAAALQQVDADTKDTTALRAYLADPEFAKIAHDDTGPLASVEKAARWLMTPSQRKPMDKGPAVMTGAEYSNRVREFMQRNPQVDADTARSLMADGVVIDNVNPLVGEFHGPKATPATVAAGLYQSFIGQAQNSSAGVSRMIADWLGLKDAAAQHALDATRASNRIAFSRPEFDSTGADMVYGGGESLAANIPGIGLGLLTGPAGGLALMGMQVQGQAYNKYRDRGATIGQATLGSSLEGAIEIGTELLPMKALTERFGKVGLGELASHFLGREMVGEQLATFLQDGVDTAIANPNKTWGEFLAERPEAALRTAVATIVQFGAIAGASSAARHTFMAAQSLDYQARENDRFLADMKELLNVASGSKLIERDPDSFAQFVNEAARDQGGDGHVYVDGQVLAATLAQSGVTLAQVEKLSPTVAAQLADSSTMNAPVAIPLGDLVGKFAGLGLEQKLIPHLRATEEGLSQEEAKVVTAQAQQMLQQASQHVMQSAVEDVATQLSAARVKATLYDQLTAANRFTKDVNDAYASLVSAFYNATSQRLGITPEELYARYPLRIQAVVDAEQTLGQGRTVEVDKVRHPDTDSTGRPIHTTFQGQVNFWRGFRGSKAVDTDGRPLRVYHGTTRDFSSFSPQTAGENTGAANAGKGFFFSGSPSLAGVYASMSGTEGANLVPAYLALHNPVRVSAPNMMEADKQLLAQLQDTHDGAIMQVGEGATKQTVYMVRTPEQVKSAIGNNGQFDPANPDMLSQSRVKELTPAISRLLKNLTPAEQGKVTQATAEKIIAQLANLPSTKEMAAIAHAGRAKRGWYAQSAQAISAVFGPDAPRFAALLAAMSPQCSVQDNLTNALNTWKNWIAAGRPETRAEIVKVMGASVIGSRGVDSVLDSWINNTVRALTSEDPAEMQVLLSGPKVNSFFRNLIGDVNEVTNDAWMGNYALVDKTLFAGSLNPAGTDPGKGVGYMAMNARVRDAAAQLTKLTGETWTPAEVQETIWSWAKTLYELADTATEQRTAEQIVSERGVTDDLINSTPDFGSLFYNPEYRSILEDAGYGEKLTGSQGPGRNDASQPHQESAAGGQAAPFAGDAQLRYERAAARRLDALREQRRSGTLAQGAVDDAGQQRPEPTGDGSGRPARGDLAPLEGAPSVPGVHGPDARLVDVAEQYARDHGIEHRRQAEYVQVDAERASRIAAAYEAMQHAPQDPKVREAYQNLIDQTTAQYRALEAAGYKFWFIDTGNAENLDYASTPWNAMRDLRANQEMGVFPTAEGFGSSADFSPEANPLLQDTGIQWPFGGPDGPLRPVLANDLFRAVHDAFGHGLEGAGFRAQGEENAWQAHSRLFTGSALAALTSETRGQNSWLNFGPHGETNRTAKVEDTVFADQKTGLMPEWTWTEGKAADMQDGALAQGGSTRGTFSPASMTITLLEKADLSTFLHETGHFFLEAMADMADQADAPGDVTADMRAVLDWFGVKDLATWRSMTLEQQRASHEQFAEAFEHYLFEGKAPSHELQGLFSRFRSWLANVYRSLTQFMASYNTKLSDEVRGVFDRLLATQTAIEDANAQRGFTPLFTAIADSGMDMGQWEKYQSLNRDAVESAMAQLQARSLRDLRWVINAQSRELKRLTKDVGEKRKAVESEVRAEVQAEPVYAVQRWIKTGVMPDGTETVGAKLSMPALREMYGDGPAAPWRYLATNLVTNDVGLHPDVIAEMFGMSSGDEMVRRIVAAFPMETEVQGRTDQRMLERYGDLATPDGLKRAADEAVHNEARGRALATELAALQAGTTDMQDTGRTSKNGNPIRANVMVKAAREFAANMIANRKIKDLKPSQHQAAETRAAKRAMEASKKGDTQTAMTEKRNQLLNFYAARETQDALDEVDKAIKYLRRIADSKTLDPAYREQIETLLERFSLRTTSNKQLQRNATLVEWVERQRDMGVEPEIPPQLLDEALRKNYRDMSVEEFRGLVDTVKQMEHFGRLKHALLTAKNDREFGAVVTEITTSIIANAHGKDSDTRTPNTVLGEGLIKLKKFAAAHIKAATWARIMDGGKDGGPVWEYVIRAANDAGNREVVSREQAARAMAALIAPVMRLGDMGGKGIFIPLINRSMNREARLAVALNTGNDSNLQRLMGGENWTHAHVDAVVNTLSEAEWAFVQNVWDYFETFRPEIAAKEKRVSGIEPKWLTATARNVATSDGKVISLRGGYYPVKYDPRASNRAEQHADAESARQQLKGAYTAATTRRSFTKTRSEEVHGRPLLYSLDGIYQGVNEVIHDLSWHEFLIDANRLVKNDSIAGAMRQKYGPEAHQQLKKWLEDIAAERPADNEGWAGAIRQGVSIAGIGFNIMSALIQPLGVTQSWVRIGTKWIGRGVAQYTAHPFRSTDEVHGKSDFMRTRALTRLRELAEVRSTVKGRGKVRAGIDTGAYFMMLQAQQMVDIPTWLGAYEKAIVEGGNDEERAVALADQAVIDSQGSGTVKDQSAIERGGQAAKLFTVFYSFFNTALNVGVQETYNEQSKPALAAKYALLYVIPVVLGALLKDAITPGDSGDWDDPKKIAKTLTREELSYLFGLMVGLREFAGASQALTGTQQFATGYPGPAGTRLVADTYKLGKELHQGDMDDGLRKAMINVVGELARLPAAQVNRSITGAKALHDGKTHNPAALVMGYQEPHP